MKHLKPHRHLPVALLLVSSSMALSPAQAQQPEGQVALRSQWDELQTANSRIQACRVVWKRVLRVNPRPSVDPEKRAATALAAARARGLTEEQAQQRAEIQRRIALSSKQGRIINSTLDFVRVGNTVLCHIENLDPETAGRSIEFSNGVDNLFVRTQVKGKEVSKDGTLMRDPEEVLAHTAGGFQVARILLGIPLNQNFDPTNPALSSRNASLKRLPNGDVTVERDARIEGQRSQDPDALVFAKGELYPISADTFDTLITVDGDKYTMQKHDLRMRSMASEHKQYPGGIWFPSKVIQTTPVSTTEFSLVEAKFNDQVDPADVRLPPDLNIADVRFVDASKPINYKVKDGKLLSDEQVKVLIQEDKGATQAKAKSSKADTPAAKASASPLVSVMGLGLIGLGGLLLLAERRRKS